MARRKDLKGRVLKDGESQRKNGMYQYRYQTESGKRHTIYSMSLTELRQKEDDIKNKIYNGLKTNTNNITLNDVYQVYIDSRTELKQSTRGNYKYLYEKYVRNEIGFRKIASFKYSDMSRFYKHMLDEKGFKPHSLEALHSVLHPVFSMAVRDGYLRLNPTDGLIREIKKKRDWHMQKRHALTIEEQRKIIDFVTRKNYYRQWKNIIIVLLGTGLRISELCGLTWSDCDFENNVISVKRNLIYRVQENGKAEFHITTPKTSAGTRDIPMLTAVKAALLDEKEKQQELGFDETVVDGLSGFIFQTRDGNVTSQHNVTRALKRIVEKCNEEEKVLAERENREPQYVREFTAHNLRHTFCSRFCENEPNIKVIQEIMGHADISTTMDIYAEVTTAKKKAVFEELDNKIELF
jgi:integrase